MYYVTVQLTVTIMQWLSWMAPQHPKKAMTKIIDPITIKTIGGAEKFTCSFTLSIKWSALSILT